MDSGIDSISSVQSSSRKLNSSSESGGMTPCLKSDSEVSSKKRDFQSSSRGNSRAGASLLATRMSSEVLAILSVTCEGFTAVASLLGDSETSANLPSNGGSLSSCLYWPLKGPLNHCSFCQPLKIALEWLPLCQPLRGLWSNNHTVGHRQQL